MTYRELKSHLENLSEEQLDHTVVLYDDDNVNVFKIGFVWDWNDIIPDDVVEFLEFNHPFFEF